MSNPDPTLPAPATDPSRRPRRGVGSWLVDRAMRFQSVGTLDIVLPSGACSRHVGARPGQAGRMEIHSYRLLSRLLLAGDIGLGESYMAGEWTTPDLSAVMRFGLQNKEALKNTLGRSGPARLRNRLRHAGRANTKAGSRGNIRAHYDLGNEFYQLWLDESMTYSSALFEDDAEPLATAQRRKYLRLAAALDLQPGDRVLEIGCGWGGFAELAAAEFGCHVVGLTLSEEQAAYARARLARAGLDDRVEIRLQDYRDVDGRFDKIASIEMFEAVGERYWPVFFGRVHDLLREGGRAGLQIITIAEENFESYRRNPDFIQKYIFPGGMLPSTGALNTAVGQAGLALGEVLSFGRSYAETLRRWEGTFRACSDRIGEMGHGDAFRRMWRFYLCYCEVGFDFGLIDVRQVTLRHAGTRG